MEIFLIIFGAALFIYGGLKISGIIKEDISKDSEMDKRLMSGKTRYFIGRYYSGFQFMVGGLAFVALGLIIYFS